MSKNDQVRIGFSDINQTFYFRFFVDFDENDSFLEGDFHFAIPYALKEKIASTLKKLNHDIKFKDSKDINKTIRMSVDF